MILAGETVADRYIVEEMIGRGGMAVVYRVRHSQLGSVHALKLLAVPRKSLSKRLLLEGQVQARLRHPNVVSVTDVVEVQGNLGLVMEFIEPPNLDDLLRDQGPLSEEAALPLFASILAAVAAAHDDEVLHRDLKPANILLARGPVGFVPKVADFGLARMLSEADSGNRTLAGSPMGTPGFMAPEQIRDARLVDARADVFALGAVLYTMLCGSAPWVGDDPTAVMSATLTTPPQAIEGRVGGISAPVAAAIARALAPDPDQRFADVRAFAAALLAEAPDLLALVARPDGDMSGWVGGRSVSGRSRSSQALASAPRPAVPVDEGDSKETFTAHSEPPREAPATGGATRLVPWPVVAAALGLVIIGTGALGALALVGLSRGPDVPVAPIADAAGGPSMAPSPVVAEPSPAASEGSPAQPGTDDEASAAAPSPLSVTTPPVAASSASGTASEVPVTVGAEPASGTAGAEPVASVTEPSRTAEGSVEPVVAAVLAPVAVGTESPEVTVTPTAQVASVASPNVLGVWQGKAGSQVMTLEITGQDGERLTGLVRFVVGPSRRTVALTGTVDAGGAIALNGDDGGPVAFTGRAQGSGMQGTFARQGSKDITWSVAR